MTHKRHEHWLDRYASNYHAWKSIDLDGRKVFSRPLSLVETSFDTDGRHYGGRADMNSVLKLEIKHSFSTGAELRRRVTLAWTLLRLNHVMLMSRTIVDPTSGRRQFAIDIPATAEESIQETLENIVWVEELYPKVDENELHMHFLNVGRIIDPEKCFSRLHVLPLVKLANGNLEMRCLIVMGHQISDGLSAYNWFSHFLRILNTPSEQISRDIASHIKEGIKSKLPPAQEDWYPKIAGNKARQRWFWAIVRVLRHVRKTLPPTFVNPLRREKRREEAITYPPTFDKLLDYSEERKPPMNTGRVVAALSPAASKRLMEMCRSIKVSIGAGCFALAGISMMEMYERQHPQVADAQQPAFVASFPLNPRAFFGFNTPAESCMLAFSEGIVMPFLPSNLPVEGRFRLISRHANRELKMYQKRLKGKTLNMGGNLADAHSPGRLLANGYLMQIERVESKLPQARKTGVNPQGELPASVGTYGATCGVSSVGSTAAFLRQGAYGLDLDGGKDFVADFRSLFTNVRARDNEFLAGSTTDGEGIVSFSVSYDANAISEEKAEIWADKVRSLLEPEDKARL